MSKVEVLCPNGHRVTISVSQTTKIIKVLEEACLRKGFLPICDYELRHGKKTLECSASIQEAALINLAKLELVKRTKPWVESKVLVQVQTSTGARMQREFMPPDSLFEILERFEEDDGRGEHPKLLFHTDKAMQPVLNYVKEEIIGHYALRETTLKSLGVLGGRVMFRHMYRQITDKQTQEIEEEINKEKSKLAKLLERSVKIVAEEQSAISCSAHVEMHEEDKKERSPLAKKAHFVKEEKISEDLTMSVIQKDVVASTASQKTPVVDVEDSFKSLTSVNSRNPFANFKFPEETKGKDLYRNELSDIKREEFLACDREIVVYKLEEKMEVDVGEELPDTFFEVTENDLAILQRDLEKNVRRLSEHPLMTEAMRRNELEAKMSKYKRVFIRIQFPDRTSVQGLFQPQETVHAVYKFVRGLLKDESAEFELYTTPPKHVLDDKTQTLMEANLVPMTRIYFGSSANATDGVVKSDILEKITNRMHAEEVVSKYIVSAQTRELKAEAEKKKTTTKKEQKASGAPKWLQIGKK